MTDSFTLLDEPRRPWLDAGALKQKFLPLSSAAHPNVFLQGHTLPLIDCARAHIVPP